MNPKTEYVRERWYKSTFVLMELVKLSKNRELSFLSPNSEGVRVRHINASFVDILKKNFKGFHFLERELNMYYSLANLNKMPMFSFAPEIRKQQQAEFNKNFNNYFVGYDLGIDFDGNKEFDYDLGYYNEEKVKISRKHYGKDGIESYDIIQNGSTKQIKAQELIDLPKEEQIQRAREDLLKLKKEVDSYKIPYSIKFSGNKGFHLNIPNQVFPEIGPNKKVEISYKLTQEFSKILNLPTIDTRLMEKRRIWALPYSLKGENVVLPLLDEQINNFKLRDMNALNVLVAIKIKNRGLLERNNNLPLEIKKENFKQMLKDYEVKI